MPLISERLRLRRQAEREAAGEVLWGEMISQEARVKIAQLWRDVVHVISAKGSPLRGDAENWVAGLVLGNVRRSTGTEPACIKPEQLARTKADTLALLDVFQALHEQSGS